MVNVMTEEPAPIRSRRRSVPEAVEAAVLTVLEKLPADRFGNAGAFAEALADPAFALDDESSHYHAR